MPIPTPPNLLDTLSRYTRSSRFHSPPQQQRVPPRPLSRKPIRPANQISLLAWVLLDKLNALLNILLEIDQTRVQQPLLVLRYLANRHDLLHAIRAQLYLAGKVLYALVLVERAVHECRLHNALHALRGLEQALREPGASHCHAQRCAAGAVLGLDHLIAAELHAVDEVVEGFALDVAVARLRDERYNGDPRVTAHHNDVLVGRVRALDLRDEARCTDNIEGGHAEEALGVVDTFGLEDFGDDGDRGVDLLTGTRISAIKHSGAEMDVARRLRSKDELTGFEMMR